MKPTICFFIIGLTASVACAQPTGVLVPIQVLAQSPADTHTDLQVICLFRSVPENALRGSLLETNEKLTACSTASGSPISSGVSWARRC